MTLSDIKRMIAKIAADAQDEERLEERIDIIRHKLKFISEKPHVACIGGLSPLMIAGGPVPGLVDIAGGTALPATNGEHSPGISPEALLKADPQILILMPEGFAVGQTLQEIHALLELPRWQELQAVKNNQLYIADGSRYFYRTDKTLVDSIELLAEIINPKQFVFGYEGEGWIRFSV